MLELDIHGLSFKEATKEIEDFIKSSYKRKLLTVKIIHGYNNGRRIKDWILNTKRFEELVTTIEEDILNSGVTNIHLKLH